MGDYARNGFFEGFGGVNCFGGEGGGKCSVKGSGGRIEGGDGLGWILEEADFGEKEAKKWFSSELLWRELCG